jgi:pilus assembly protein CpaC
MSRVTLFRPAAVSGMLMAGLLTILALVAPTPARAQGAEDLRITAGKSLVIDYPVDVARISTSNPEIVDAVAVSTREILLHAKSLGVSTIVIWSKEGQRTFYNVTVDQNLEPARRLIRETFPNEDVQVLGSRDSITLIGRATTKEMSDRVSALAASLAKTVVNNLKIAPPPVEKQVILRVKFVELDRNKSAQYGVNLFSTGFGNTPATIGTGQIGGQSLNKVQGAIPGGSQGYSTELNIKDVLNIFAFRPDLNLGATVRALQNQGVLQILAEPNLVTTVGKEASFLVGGEFPIPVLQGGSGASAVTIQFREFGIRLTFNPQLTENGTLKMYVKPEVSTIDLANSVTLNGFTIPALATRRMETNVELAQGQSFVIGGLIDDRVNEQLSKIPGLSSIPVLGALFKTRIENKSKSELIVMVTPELIDPLNPSDPKPDLNMPIDWLQALPPKAAPKKQSSSAPLGRSDYILVPAEQQVVTTRFAPVPEVVSAKRLPVPETTAMPAVSPTVAKAEELAPPNPLPETSAQSMVPAGSEPATQAATNEPAAHEPSSPLAGTVPLAAGPSPATQAAAR